MCGSLYRPPNTDLEMFFRDYELLLIETKKKWKNVILGLDHNLDFLKSSTHKGMQNFVQTTLEHGLVPTITRPTRITKSTATLIDNILVSQNFCNQFTSSMLLDDMSDHLPSALVIHDVFANKKGKVSVTSRDMRPRYLLALKTHLEKMDWTKFTTSPDYDTNVTHIHEPLMISLGHYVPEKTRHINYRTLRREPWITAGILTSTRKAKKLFRQTQVKNCLQSVIDKYKNYNRMLQQIRHRAEKSHYLLMCAKFKNNTKKLWHTINEISGKMSDKSGIIDYIKVGDITYYQPKQIANELGKYFGKVGQVFAGKIPKSTKSIY